MKRFRYLGASTIIAAASFTTLCYAGTETTAPAPRTHANECTVSADPSLTPTGSASKPPRLSVGVSDPDTKLNLPWFLTDSQRSEHASIGPLLRPRASQRDLIAAVVAPSGAPDRD